MKRLIMPTLAGLLLVLAIGCANPADNAPEAVVEEPTAAPPQQTAPTANAEATTYTFTEDSTIGFVGSKITGSHDGGFKDFDGSVMVNGDDLTTTEVKVMIDTTTLWADNEQLTGHLKSDDFFSVANHPTASFDSTSVSDNGDGTYTVTGNLDLHGVSKQISFPAQITKDEYGMVSTQAEFSINRFDFEIEYKGKADDLIRDEVLIKLDFRAEAGDDAMLPADDDMADDDMAGEEAA